MINILVKCFLKPQGFVEDVVEAWISLCSYKLSQFLLCVLWKVVVLSRQKILHCRVT